MIAKLKISFLAPYNGISFILKNSNLIKYFIIPVLISILIYIFAIISLIYNFNPLISNFFNIIEYITPAFLNNYFIFILFKYFLFFIVIISILYLFILLFNFLLNIICSPFNEFLTKKILLNFKIKLSNNNLNIAQDIFRILKVELKKIVFLSLLSIASTIISSIPILALLSLIINCFILGYYYIDYSLEVNLFTFKERLIFIKSNFIYIFIFGLSLSLILLIPILNFIFIIYAVSGGAILFKYLNIKH